MGKSSPKKIFMIAGETSGDYLGEKLISDIKSLRNDVEFLGIGGSRMANAGLRQIFSIDQLSIIGIWEAVKKVFYIKNVINETVKNILAYKPDVVVTIDFPGFTSRVGKALKNATPGDIPIVHYVAPSVWAWRSNRAKNVRKFADKLLTLFPFEPELFSKYGMDTVFVGHPIAVDPDFNEPLDSLKGDFLNSIGFFSKYDQNCRRWENNIKDWSDDAITIKICGTAEEERATARKFLLDEKSAGTFQSQYKIITLLPGSRSSEINEHMPIFKELVEKISRYCENARFIMPTVESLAKLVREYVKSWSVCPVVITSKAEKTLAYYVSDIAIAASGTVSLELARAGLPSIIIYKTSSITAAFVKSMLKIKYVSLVNILSGNRIIPEFLQEDCKADKIFNCAIDLLNDSEKKKTQKQAFKLVMSSLIPSDSQLAAKEVLKMCF